MGEGSYYTAENRVGRILNAADMAKKNNYEKKICKVIMRDCLEDRVALVV